MWGIDQRPAYGVVAVAVGVAVSVTVLTGCGGAPRPVGNPDPGHRLLQGIQPVLSVIPPGAHVTLKQSDEPRWDSCDGVRSTYGWDPATLDAEFTGGGSAPQVVARTREAMRALGWTFESGSLGEGTWTWHKTLPGGASASTQLMGGPGVVPPDWTLEATVPPATHPSKDC